MFFLLNPIEQLDVPLRVHPDEESPMPRKKASAGTGRAKTSASVKDLIATVRAEQAAIAAEAHQRGREKLQAVIDAKKTELAAAQAKANEAQKAADAVASDLDQLLAAAGLARLGRKKGAASGRKPRVSVERKRAEVEKALGKLGKGVEFAKLRESLLAITDAEIGGAIFSVPDFNSAKGFGKKLLPKGWRVVGERKEARVERKQATQK